MRNAGYIWQEILKVLSKFSRGKGQKALLDPSILQCHTHPNEREYGLVGERIRLFLYCRRDVLFDY